MDPGNPEKKSGSPQAGPTIPQIEEEITKFWEENDIFNKSLEKTKDGAPYTFYDGPPFATGLPHYGHILASTIKDLIPRYQTMRGRFVRRRWGWDCHGLPIEALVEKKLEISGKKQIEEVGIKTFNETCRSLVLQYVEEWGKMVRRMGRWIEFEDSYKTMDRDYMESVWWAFKQVHDKGLAYEGRKVLLYCPRCETPISNFEVAMDNSYKDLTEESVYVKFKVRGEENTYLLAWTTTPWTLPGNVALAVGNDIDYVKVRHNKETFILAKVLAEKVLPAGYENIAEVKGEKLVSLSYEPLFNVPDVAASDKSFKVYAADFVTTEDGTGIVHTAVVYGEDDYQLGLREGLPVVPLLDEKGHFNERAPELIRGQYFKKSEKAVKDDLEARGLLLKREAYTHPYPHCWRCNTALFYNAIPAWFINVQKIKADLIKTNTGEPGNPDNPGINWFPEHLKHGRYQKSVEAAPDWNISRNRYWGNPIPVWKCAECGKDAVVGSLDDIAQRAPKSKNRYILMRHGESENYVHDVISSNLETQAAYDLTAEGVAHAEESVTALKDERKDEKIDLIYTSDFRRTSRTAEIAAKILGIKDARIDERLREINTGEFDGRPIQDYKDFFKNRLERFVKRPPGGETVADVVARAWSFLKDMEEQYEGKTILIASHEDVLWAMEGTLRGWDARKMSAEKGNRDGMFIAPAEAREVPLLPLPRNDRGEVDMHRPYIDEVVLRCDCGGEMRRTPEIFDSWVEAGSMPFSEYHYPFENKELFESRFPGQFVAEYIAQTRAWFYVMHVISQIIFGRAPFENVVTTGNILAEDGSKMSKSKNNYPDPWIVIDRYGVDTLRFYLMNSVVMEADNVDFSVKDVESIHRKVTMILWNVQQYYKTYRGVVSSELAVGRDGGTTTPRPVLDRWIIARTKELVTGVTDQLDAYNTVRASRVIMGYVDDLSTWYLRRSRGREDESFFPAFRQALVTLSKVLAPFMPHIAEAVYRNVRTEQEAESVHLADWPEKEELNKEEEALIEGMAVVREAASAGLAGRKELNIPVRQPLARLYIEMEGGEPLFQDLIDILLAELNVKALDEKLLGAKGGNGSIKEYPINARRIKSLYLDTKIDDELRLEGEIRRLERAIQEKRKEMGLKVGEMARLEYFADDATTEAAFKGIDTKKTYIAEMEKGDGLSGGFELEKV